MMDEHAWEAFYRSLALIAGLPRPETPCPHPAKDGVSLQWGWPDLRIGLAYEGDDPVPFRQAGWTVFAMPAQLLNTAVPFLHLLSELDFERKVRVSKNGANLTTSHAEDRLVAELFRCGLPAPDRNRQFHGDDGRLLTVPDMVWETAMLAVFVDGLYWHGGRQREEILRVAAADPVRAAQLEATERAKATKDASARRALVKLGWRTIAVTDQELESDDEVKMVAYEIVEAYRQSM